MLFHKHKRRARTETHYIISHTFWHLLRSLDDISERVTIVWLHGVCRGHRAVGSDYNTPLGDSQFSTMTLCCVHYMCADRLVRYTNVRVKKKRTERRNMSTEKMYVNRKIYFIKVYLNIRSFNQMYSCIYTCGTFIVSVSYFLYKNRFTKKSSLFSWKLTIHTSNVRTKYASMKSFISFM